MPKKIFLQIGILVAIFLIGFVPGYTRANSLQSQLRKSEIELKMSRLRDLVSLAYFEAADNNFGLALRTSTQYFDQIRELSLQSDNAAAQKVFGQLLGYRDKVTSLLAKADPTSLNDLKTLYAGTRHATELLTGR